MNEGMCVCVTVCVCVCVLCVCACVAGEQEVCQRVWDTLYDFPRLRQCAGLLRYVDECVRLSWALSVQNPSFHIQYEHARFSPDLHTRFHTSDPASDAIRAVLWPVLTEGETGLCVYKGVVVT